MLLHFYMDLGCSSQSWTGRALQYNLKKTRQTCEKCYISRKRKSLGESQRRSTENEMEEGEVGDLEEKRKEEKLLSPLVTMVMGGLRRAQEQLSD